MIGGADDDHVHVGVLQQPAEVAVARRRPARHRVDFARALRQDVGVDVAQRDTFGLGPLEQRLQIRETHAVAADHADADAVGGRGLRRPEVGGRHHRQAAAGGSGVHQEASS